MISMNKRFELDTAHDFNSETIKEKKMKKKVDRIRKKVTTKRLTNEEQSRKARRRKTLRLTLNETKSNDLCQADRIDLK